MVTERNAHTRTHRTVYTINETCANKWTKRVPSYSICLAMSHTDKMYFSSSSSTALTPFAHRNYCILYSFLPSLNVFFEAKFHASVIFLALDFCTDLQWRKNVNLIEPNFSSPLSVNNKIFFSKFYFSSMFSMKCHSWWIILKLH